MKRSLESAPACLGPAASLSDPGWTIPRGAWDTHFHVLGPTSQFPYSPTRRYTPPDASLKHCRAMHDTLGIDRGFAVHANTHGFDNAVDLDAVAQSQGRYLAVVRLDGRVSVAGCRALNGAGVRGVRFAFNPQHGGALDADVFDHVLRCMDGLGWFVELHFDGACLPELEPWIAGIPAPVLIDHFGRIDPGLGLEQKPFEALARLAGRENVWIKISGADRLSRQGAPYADVTPFARRLTEIAADRLLWGSDWPNTGYFDSRRLPDAGRLLGALAGLVPDDSVRRMILVDNPLRLLGTGASTFLPSTDTTG
jgi:predicted TIM-barrel fold metal-dependent hydrolase